MTHTHRRASGKHSKRSGITLVGFLVVIAVVSVLTALLIQAVHRARESARALRCKDNLRQLGVAATSFSSVRGKLATRLSDLLPYLEQTATYDRLSEYEAGVAQDLKSGGVSQRAFPTGLTTPVILRCPSETQSYQELRSNYFINDGTRFRYSHSKDTNGILGDQTSRAIISQGNVSAVIDGLSQTALYSERLLPGDEFGKPSDPPRREAWRMHGTPESPEALAALYDQEQSWSQADSISEYSFRRSMLANRSILDSTSKYDHILPPNSRPVFADRESVSKMSTNRPSSRPATSLHGGGVHVVFGDGHVLFVSDDIDIHVWRALGTRNGREIVSDF